MKAGKTPPGFKISDFEDKSLLIVDDDDPLRMRLSRAMEKKGFQVKDAKTVENAIKMVISAPPKFALVDLRLEDGNGLDVVKEINKLKKDSRIVMLTGYGNLPTAVAAVKSGAIDYLAKPVDADDVEAVVHASNFALEYRMRYERDVFIDLLGYRKYGHNEGAGFLAGGFKQCPKICFDSIKKDGC